jgi:hypothetical protein
VRIGGITIEKPLVSLQSSGGGQEYADGLMGLRLLRLIDLAIDPSSQVLWIRRNGLAPLPDTGRYATI